MSARDWEAYLWDLLPRPYKVLSERERERDPTEARKFVNAISVEAQRVQEMIERIRANWLIPSMDARLLDTKGWERGKLTRWAGESDEEFRLRVANAFDWFALGGTAAGIKKILELLGYRNVSITERVTEEQWAESGVNVALASGDMLVTENIERVKRIVNEIKAAHTRLVSTNVEYDPPDIGLDPDHIHRYDWCYYDLGLWPRAIERWGTSEEIISIVRMFMRREHLKRMVIALSPMYDGARYDALYDQIWKLYQHRRHYGTSDRLIRYRRWIDGDTWGGGWSDRVKDASSNLGKRLTYSYSMGVYDASTYGSLNSAYAPRYRFIDDIGVYGTTRYDDKVEAPGYKPIYRYYARVWRGDIAMPDARSSNTSMSVKASETSIKTTASSSPKQSSSHFGSVEMVTESRTWMHDTTWDENTWTTTNKEVYRTMQAAIIKRTEAD